MFIWLRRLIFGIPARPRPRIRSTRRSSPRRNKQRESSTASAQPKVLPAPPEDPPWAVQIPAASHELELVKPSLLRQLLRDKDVSGINGNRDFVSRLVEFVGKQRLDLPPFPDVAMQLDRVLKSADVQMTKVVQIAEKDPALVQQVWKQATSAQFAVPPSSFRLAVARIGFDPLWQIAMRTCLYSPVFRAPGYQSHVDQVRERGIVVGELATQLVPMLGGQAYIAGLLHEIGMLIIFKHASYQSPKVEKPSPVFVNAINNGNHAAVGVMVAHAWGLGEVVASGIGYYLEPRLAPPKYQKLAMAIRAASIAAQTAEAARQGVAFGGLEVLSAVPNLGIEPAKLIQLANQGYDALSQNR